MRTPRWRFYVPCVRSPSWGILETAWEPRRSALEPALNHCAPLCGVAAPSWQSCPVPASWESRLWEAPKGHGWLHLRFCVFSLLLCFFFFFSFWGAWEDDFGCLIRGLCPIHFLVLFWTHPVAVPEFQLTGIYSTSTNSGALWLTMQVSYNKCPSILKKM